MQEKFERTIVEFDRSSGIGTLVLNRPDSLNALDSQLRKDIVAGLRRLEEENDNVDGVALRAVIIEGAEENFSTGADINEFTDASPARDSEPPHYDIIIDFPAPVIAKIRGYCLGGGLETALACDFRFADEDAQFGFPEADLGIMPGAGGVQFVSRLTNPSVAKELAMTGDDVSANRAREVGILNRVFESSAELDEGTRDFAEQIASKPPLSVQAVKDSANIASEVGLDEGRRYDRQLSDQLHGTDDHEKATRAFAEEEYEPEFDGT